MVVPARPGSRALLMLITFAVIGCNQQRNEYVAPPPPKVTVSQPAKREFVDHLEFTGSLAAMESVDLRARVQGFLDSLHFKDGHFVEKNQLLFVIDPKPFQADLERAVSQVKIHNAEVVRAQTELARNQKLLANSAASESEVVKWQGQLEVSKGEVAAAEADVALAQLNLGYTQVRAPFDGRMGRRQVDVGNLVGAGQDTLLGVIIQDDPVYVYFSMSERDALRLRQSVRENMSGADDSVTPIYERIEVPLRVALADEKDFPHRGRIDYVDPVVDVNTGTLTVRGVIPNTKRILVPGMFVRVRMPVGKARLKLFVPESALGVDQGGRYVLVVNDQNQVESRQVSVGGRDGSMVVVEDGLSEQDRVVVNGIQRARPGATVTPTIADKKPDKTTSGAKPDSSDKTPSTGSSG